VINSVEYQNVGVSLSVTPRIGADGAVRMEIGTTNSALSSSPVTVAVGVTAPIINERRAMTSVSVQSGQSIIIGGLISTSDDKRTKKSRTWVISRSWARSFAATPPSADAKNCLFC